MTKILSQAAMLLMLLSPSAPGQAAGPDAVATAVSEEAPARSTVERLVSISDTVAEQRSHLGELERRLAETTDAVERKEIEAEMETTRGRIAKLKAAFEEAVTGGITAAALVDEPAERINWRAELEKISLPILASLRDLTEKPRRIEELRGEIDKQEERLALAQHASAAIAQVDPADLDPVAANRLNDIAETWQAHESELRQGLETASYQLAALTGDETSWGTALREGFVAFARGRGLTLLIAVAVGVLVWLTLRVGSAPCTSTC